MPQLKQRVSGFAANGGAATLAVRKVADALKACPSMILPISTLTIPPDGRMRQSGRTQLLTSSQLCVKLLQAGC